MISEQVKELVMLICRLKTLVNNLNTTLLYNYYENQDLYVAANKAKLVSLAFKTNRVSLGGASTSITMTTLIVIRVKIHKLDMEYW